MKYSLPIIAGSIVIAAILVLRQQLGPYTVLHLSAVLIVMPLAEVLVQGKSGRLKALAGMLIGAVVGLALGYSLGPIISETIFGQISIKDNIRIDLVFWWALGASITSTIFALIGGWFGRRS